jgi:hypothetical protein
MLTRRAILTGTAAASIGAIATARGIATAELTSQEGFGEGFGDLVDGAIGAFNKDEGPSFHAFMKFRASAADVFYKEQPGGVEVFFKTFFDKWTPVTSFFLKSLVNLDGAAAAFNKLDPHGAEFFVKVNSGMSVVTTVETGEEGTQIHFAEITPD